jgi:AAHS family 4-hydroxybenzoate transporter-like MFS transporter
MRSANINVEAYMEETPFSRFQILTVLLCGLIAAIDGFDAQIMGFVAPSLGSAFQISRSALGPVFSAGLLGMMVGSLICGPLADRIGRKPVLLLCLIWFGVWSLVTPTADSLYALVAIRFIYGRRSL